MLHPHKITPSWVAAHYVAALIGSVAALLVNEWTLREALPFAALFAAPIFAAMALALPFLIADYIAESDEAEQIDRLKGEIRKIRDEKSDAVLAWSEARDKCVRNEAEIKRLREALSHASSHDRTGEDHLAEMMAMAAEVDPLRAENVALHRRQSELAEALSDRQGRIAALREAWDALPDEMVISEPVADLIDAARGLVYPEREA